VYATKSRLNNFDCLRLLLAVVVIFSHSFPLAGSESDEPFFRITNGQTTGGEIAVDLFFIMSGYLITGSFFHSASILDYLGKRIRRIYPGFITCMLFGALLVVPLAGGVLTDSHKPVSFVAPLLLLNRFSQTGAFSRNPFPYEVNGSVWTIPYEFGFYLGILILGVSGALARRALVSGMFLASIVISIAFHIWVRPDSFEVSSHCAHLAPMYLAGVVAYLYRGRISYTRTGGVVCFLALWCACVIPFAWAPLFPIAGAYVLFWTAFNQSIRFHGVGKRGDFSYGTYLYAFPLQQTIVGVWAKPINPLLLFLVATPLALVFGFASWHLIERPLLRVGKATNSRKKAELHRSLSISPGF